VWPPLLATEGAGAQSEMHAHHAMHFVLARRGELKLRTSPRAPWVNCAGALTAPDAPHAIDARGETVLFVFLDPQSDVGECLLRVVPNGVRCVMAKERDQILAGASATAIMGGGGAEWMRRAAGVLGAVPSEMKRPAVHPRVRKLLRLLQSDDRGVKRSLQELAGAVGLSPGRMMHVFTSSVGVPLRPYLAWLKLQRAAGAIVTGLPLTEAAQMAGFSDAGHMSRTFRRMFGVAPSQLRPPRKAAS
jgi:AraC-like DNA-binding protein